MKTSDSIKSLAGALLKAQGEFTGVVKDKANGAFRGAKYADLQTVIDATAEPLRANGLLVLQTPRGCVATQSATVVTRLLHASGEWIEDELELPAGTNQRCDAQTFGSAITYARRYSYLGILGIAPEDDDGNVASGHARVSWDSSAGVNRPFTVVTKPSPTPPQNTGDAYEEDPLFDENGELIESKATVQHRENKQAVAPIVDVPSTRQAQPGDKRISTPQAKRFLAIAKSNGKDWPEINAALHAIGVQKAEEMPFREYDVFIAWAGGQNERRA